MNEYTDQDTDRVRTAERSSAGQQTQQLGAASVTRLGAPAAPQRYRNNPVAIGLIILGALLLLGRGTGGVDALLAPLDLELEGGMFFLTLSSCFLFFAFWKRIYGLLIPGCILGGFALGVTFAGLLGGAPFFWGLALGFLAIYLFGRELFKMPQPWPLFPAVGLFAFGAFVATTSLPGLLAGTFLWVPLLLIGAGLYLGFGRKASHP
ncbi:MAG TPA: hypothetical protein VFS21_34605 [Roseiflexaceae bacterium]|nr:hypothetical protein [Roseiflexaceae bacterium]